MTSKKWLSRYFVEVTIIAFISILFLMYYYSPNINYLSTGDPQHTLILSPEKEIKDYWYHWIEYNFGGGYALSASGRIIEALIFYILKMTFSPKFAFFIFIFSFILIGGYGFYLFAKNFIFYDYEKKAILSIIGASFYSTNLFVSINLAQNVNLLLAYILTPWIAYNILNYIKQGNRVYLLLAASLMSLNGISLNPPIIIISLIIVGWTILTFAIIDKLAIKKVLFALSIFFLFSLLLSVWWIIPTLIYYFNFPSDLSKTLIMERFDSRESTLLNIFHLSGYWELFGVRDGYKVFYFSEYLIKLKGYFILISTVILIPLLTFAKKTINKRNEIIILSYSILLLLAYLLAQGYNESSLIKNYYIDLMNSSNVFGTFRNNYKFVAIIAFVYAVLLPFSYLYLHNSFKNNKYLSKTGTILPKIFVVIIIISFSYPIWTISVYNHYYTGIPHETLEVSDFLNGQLKEDYGKIMIFPGTWLPLYNWAFYFLQRPIFLSTIDDRGAIIFRSGGDAPLSWSGRNLVDNFLYKGFFNINEKTLSDLGIKYFLLDKTLNTELGGGEPTANISLLEYNMEHRFTKIYGNNKYALFKINNPTNTTNNLFFIPLNARYTNKSEDELLNYLYNLRLKNVALTNTYLEDIPKLETDASIYGISKSNNYSVLSAEHTAKIIDIQKINPTKYSLHINSTKPFMLVFVEAYDNLWASYINGREYKSIPLYSVINGFWIEETGNLTVTVEYKPQRWFYYGLSISVVAMIYLIILLIKNRRSITKDDY